jgi:hypothetical protein
MKTAHARRLVLTMLLILIGCCGGSFSCRGSSGDNDVVVNPR